MALLSKYGVARDIYFPLIKRSVMDFAVSGDYTHASGDVKISKDGGAAATATNAPSAITMGNTAMWKLTLTATEMQAAQIMVTMGDAATKAVEDQMIIIETYGNASGQHAFDLGTAITAPTNFSSMSIDGSGRVDVIKVAGTSQTARDLGASVLISSGTGTGQLDVTSGVIKANLAQILGTALTETAGQIAAGFKKLFDVASPVFTLLSVNQTGDSYARIGAPAGASASADIAAVKAVLPSALVSGRIDASVGAMAANVLTAAAINADAITDAKVASDVTIASVTGAVGSVTAGVTVSTNNDKTGYGLSAAAIQAIWDALTSALTTANSIGKLLVDNINATISSRLASASYTTPPTVGAIADQVWDETLTDHLGAGSTGSALNSAGSAGDPWGTALPGAYSAGSAGYIVGTNVDALISSRTKPADTQAAVTLVATTTNLTNAPTAGDFTSTMKTSLNNATPSVTVSDKTGFSLSSAGIQAIWDKATSALTTVGSIGKLLVDNAHSAADVWAVATRLLTAGTNIVLAKGTGVTGFNDLSAAQVNAEVDTGLADVGLTTTITGRIDVAVSTRLASGSYTTPPTAVQIRQEMDSNSVDLDAIQGNQTTINTNVLSRLPTSSYTAPDNADILLIKAKTDNLPASPAAVSDIPTATENADALLKRDLSTVTGEAARSFLNALRLLRNKVVIAAGTMTVYKEDDSTSAWTAAIGTDASADPIVSVDP